ncbi:PREDICTED: specifically androgen-regulated gene protein isoform X1 [Hipposideros armiger]|uniref:Specifically androgen-regulated gene protein isoform X1 n=2 Tax=Hipposideros armiger TaxID=186990 RepID=A0A8B7Q8B6_HIPAR|nr:PREDICTED: specifically androgen-regulated gene protein isoform X1 [Hipposideros armiger]
MVISKNERGNGSSRKMGHERRCPAGPGCGNCRAKLPRSPGSPPAVSGSSSDTRPSAWISATGRPFWRICPSSQAQLGTFFASPRFPSGSIFHRPCTLLLAMPERELWPAGPGSEPVTRVSSCDSMMSTTSTRSGSSDSSYDFLSAEEKECLLFLEETIGSLDTEADSGLSTDESEQATTPQSPRALPITQPAPQGHPEGKTLQQGLVPRRTTQSSSPRLPEPQGLGLRSGSYSLPRNIHIGRNQNLRKSTPQANSHLPGEPEGLIPDPKTERVSQRSEPGQPPAEPWEAALDLEALIPPPEAFRDTQPEQCGEDSLPERPEEQSPTPQLHTSLSPQKKAETSSEAMSQKANEKGSIGAPRQPRPAPAIPSQNSRAADAPNPSGENPDVHLAPLTAPKPRKLPPNIVLKSSRSSFHSVPQNWLSRHPEAAPRDSSVASSLLQEQRKARKEALEKLGLPQDQDEPRPHLSKPTSSIRLKETRAQGPFPAPAQPAVLTQVSTAGPAAGKASAPAPTRGPFPVNIPTFASTPALVQGSSSPGKVLIPTQEPTPGKVPAAKSMPIPIPKAHGGSSPLTQPKPNSRLTLQEKNTPGLRQMNFKSNTLERSGVGLSSYFSAEKDPRPQNSTSLGKDFFLDNISPSVLRNSRPRTASLGTGKDFAGIQVGKLADLEQAQSSKRLSFQGQSRDKLPRPACVSVKISPKGIPDEHRREALKKLGLLKE